METPLLSIVTPSFNRAGMIANAIESVLAQDYPHYEHIVVDGASTDGTLDVLARYPHLRVLSEKDRNMFDALNKGFKMARGTFVAWLNTDDVYPPGAFATIAKAIAGHPDAQAISGAAEHFEMAESGPRTLMKERPIDAQDFWQRVVEAPVPNGWFFRTALVEKLGYFNIELPFVTDRDLIIRICLEGIRPVPVEQVVYCYQQHAGSFNFYPEDSRHPVYGPQRMRINTDDLKMLDLFFKQGGLPPEVLRVMRRQNSLYAYRLASTAFYHRKWEQFRAAMRSGFRYDPLFVFALGRYALRRLVKGGKR